MDRKKNTLNHQGDVIQSIEPNDDNFGSDFDSSDDFNTTPDRAVFIHADPESPYGKPFSPAPANYANQLVFVPDPDTPHSTHHNSSKNNGASGNSVGGTVAPQLQAQPQPQPQPQHQHPLKKGTHFKSVILSHPPAHSSSHRQDRVQNTEPASDVSKSPTSHTPIISYRFSRKPVWVEPSLHFRARNTFARLDPKLTGRVPVYKLLELLFGSPDLPNPQLARNAYFSRVGSNRFLGAHLKEATVLLIQSVLNSEIQSTLEALTTASGEGKAESSHSSHANFVPHISLPGFYAVVQCALSVLEIGAHYYGDANAGSSIDSSTLPHLQQGLPLSSELTTVVQEQYDFDFGAEIGAVEGNDWAAFAEDGVHYVSAEVRTRLFAVALKALEALRNAEAQFDAKTGQNASSANPRRRQSIGVAPSSNGADLEQIPAPAPGNAINTTSSSSAWNYGCFDIDPMDPARIRRAQANLSMKESLIDENALEENLTGIHRCFLCCCSSRRGESSDDAASLETARKKAFMDPQYEKNYHRALSRHRTKQRSRSHCRIFPSWMGFIDARFGTAVGSYFSMAQSLCALNFVLSLVIIACLFPAIYYFNWTTPDFVETVTIETDLGPESVIVTLPQSLLGFLWGIGMENSFLFYGTGYQVNYPEYGNGYNTDLLYVVTMIIVIALSLVILLVCLAPIHSKRVASPSTTQIAATKEDARNRSLATIVFCSIDYSLTDPTAMKISQTHLVSTLYSLAQAVDEIASHAKRKMERLNHGAFERYGLLARRVLGIILTVLIIGGACTALIFLLKERVTIISSSESWLGSLSKWAVSIPISVTRVVSASMLEIIVVSLEKRSSLPTYRHVLFRSFVLKIMFIMVLLFQSFIVAREASDVAYNAAVPVATPLVCAQTAAGINYYQQIFSDFIVDFLFATLIPFLRFSTKFLLRPCFPLTKPQPPTLSSTKKLEQLERRQSRLRGKSQGGNADEGQRQKDKERHQELQYSEQVASSLELTAEDLDAIAKYNYLSLVYERSKYELIKSEFSLQDGMLDLVAAQAMVWAAIPFAPLAPLASALCLCLLIPAKHFQFRFFTRISFRPQSLSGQLETAKLYLLATLAITTISFTYWLRSTVDCGPNLSTCTAAQMDAESHNSSSTGLDWAIGMCTSTPISTLVQYIQKLPGPANSTLQILQNPLLLWGILLIILVYAIYTHRRLYYISDEITELKDWMWLEKQELNALKRNKKIQTSSIQEFGKHLFQVFVRELSPVLRDSFTISMQECYFDDMLQLMRLNDVELNQLLDEWAQIDNIAPEYKYFVYEKLKDQRSTIISQA